MFIYDFMNCFDDQVMLYYILARFEFQFIYPLHLIMICCMTSVTHINSKMHQSPKYQEMAFDPLYMIPRKTFQKLLHLEN